MGWLGSPLPFFEGDELPAYTTEGADVQYTSVLSNAPTECFTPKGGTTPATFFKKFGTEGCPLEIKYRIRFNSSAPTRSIRFAGVRANVTVPNDGSVTDLWYYRPPPFTALPPPQGAPAAGSIMP